MSLLILAPSRAGFVLLGDSYGTSGAPELRDRGPVAAAPKTYVVHPRVAVGVTGASVLDYGVVVRLVASAVEAYAGAWNDDLLSVLDDELPRHLTVMTAGALERAAELARSEGPLSLFVLVAADGAPIAARYVIEPRDTGVAVTRDFTRTLNPADAAQLVMVGRVEYVCAFALDDGMLDDVRAFESRRIGDVPFADALSIARRIHTRADMTDVPADVVRDRFAKIELPVGWIGGALTGVVVTAAGGGARNLTSGELREEKLMAGSTLLSAVAQAASTYAARPNPQPPRAAANPNAIRIGSGAYQSR